MTHTATIDHAPPRPPGPGFGRGRWPSSRALLLAVALLAAGGAIGVGASRMVAGRPQVTLLTPSPVAQLTEWSAAAVKGSVAEIFGRAFVLQDPSGRALVDLGPQGEGADIKAGEALTVQGRFEQGVLHAGIVIHADNRTDTFGPPGGPPRGGPAEWLHRLRGH